MGFNLQNWDKSRNGSPPVAVGETLDFDVGDKASTKPTGSISLWHENLVIFTLIDNAAGKKFIRI